ncbi:MAG TPA: hypothetical protein VFI47_06055 [Acidimicrobiales bacterium]|nr:hypothetical protein [Acidimicrobiales bacterium]
MRVLPIYGGQPMPMAEAVRRLNELLDLGEVNWTAALHLTC